MISRFSGGGILHDTAFALMISRGLIMDEIVVT